MSYGGEHMRTYLDILNEQSTEETGDGDTIENEIHQMGREHGLEGKKYKAPGNVFAKLYNTQDMATIKQYVDMYNGGLAAGRQDKNGN